MKMLAGGFDGKLGYKDSEISDAASKLKAFIAKYPYAKTGMLSHV